MAGKTCQICGKNSGMYPLCKEHLEMKNQGLVIKNENGEWILKEENSQKCMVCKNIEATHKILMNPEKNLVINVCDKCIDDYKKNYADLNKNQSKYELRDYYFNLRNSIYRVKNKKILKSQITKLIAIARALSILKNDYTISERCADDIKEILAKINFEQKETKNLTIEEQSDQIILSTANIKEHRARDGHLCKSDKEVIIDDLLYNWHICHASGLVVKEIPSKQERTIISDWFIPLSGTNGIYIEYWGMDTSDYQDNEDEKKALYDKYELKLINIKKDDPNDRQNLERELYSQLIEKGWKDPNKNY